MGFMDFWNSMVDEAVEKQAAIFARATDEKLMEWYDEHKFDSETDSRTIEAAEKELRRRHLIY
ncbi:MAG: hypothetical protein K2N27_11050 [Ruminococcus sp.]|nr:hypothetical protein [Ruminococcus sp.]